MVSYDLTNNVYLSLKGPSYNIRSEQSRSNSEHNVFSTKYMNNLVIGANEVLRPGSNALLFCSESHFRTWRAFFNRSKNKMVLLMQIA